MLGPKQTKKQVPAQLDEAEQLILQSVNLAFLLIRCNIYRAELYWELSEQ